MHRTVTFQLHFAQCNRSSRKPLIRRHFRVARLVHTTPAMRDIGNVHTSKAHACMCMLVLDRLPSSTGDHSSGRTWLQAVPNDVGLLNDRRWWHGGPKLAVRQGANLCMLCMQKVVMSRACQCRQHRCLSFWQDMQLMHDDGGNVDQAVMTGRWAQFCRKGYPAAHHDRPECCRLK